MTRESLGWYAASLAMCVALVAMAADFNPETEIGDSGWSPALVAEGVVRHGDIGFRPLWTVNRDGSGAEYFCAAPGMISASMPTWSHDAMYVAFDTCPEVDQPGEGKVFVCAAAGPFKGQVLDLGFGNTPDWSPDDGQIAYMINPGNPGQAKGGTWLMNSDGTNRRWLADGFYPRWSPNGKAICIHGTGQGTSGKLVVVDMATGATRSLFKGSDWQLKFYGGNWSPDGKRIAFCGNFQGKDRLATIDADGDESSIQIVYTNEDAGLQLFGPPAWSPDSLEIVFIVQDAAARGGRTWWNSYLHIIPADGSAPPKLLEGKKVGNVNRGPSFSRDGSKIIFSSER